MSDNARYAISALAAGGIGYAVYRIVSNPIGPAECTEGDTKCEGSTEYTCINGKWMQSGTCTQPCTNGTRGCIGYDEYECVNGEWVLVKENSPYCYYVCDEGDFGCVVHDKYICVNNAWVFYEHNSPDCGYTEECAEGSAKCIGDDKYICKKNWWTGQTYWELFSENHPDCTGALSLLYELIPGNQYRMVHTVSQTITQAGEETLITRAKMLAITDSISIDGGMVEWYITNTSTDTVMQVLAAAATQIKSWLLDAGMSEVHVTDALMYDA